jgi:hypothetical protein
MAQRFLKWLGKLDAIEPLDRRPSNDYKTPSMAFGIKVRPEFVYKQGDQEFVTYLWATKLPKLTRQTAGAGLFLLREALAKGIYSAVKFQIYDLRQEKLLGEECITNQSADLLAADIALINAIWISATPKAA